VARRAAARVRPGVHHDPGDAPAARPAIYYLNVVNTHAWVCKTTRATLVLSFPFQPGLRSARLHERLPSHASRREAARPRLPRPPPGPAAGSPAGAQGAYRLTPVRNSFGPAITAPARASSALVMLADCAPASAPGGRAGAPGAPADGARACSSARWPAARRDEGSDPAHPTRRQARPGRGPDCMCRSLRALYDATPPAVVVACHGSQQGHR